jgi:uncharacterized OB-fold protein
MADPLILHQRIKLPYRYTAGPIHEAVLRGFEERKVLGGSCDGCGYVAAPARPFCPACSSKVSELVDVGELGTLLSWTAVAGDDAQRFALVRMDGSDGAMLHRIISDDPPTVGMRVRVEWSNESMTEITAISAFVGV